LDKVTLTVREKIALITINRPEKRNALNEEVRSELYDVLQEVDGRKDILVAIITGSGEAFVAGADIAAMKHYTPEDAEKASKHGSEIFLFLENMRVPVIAAINGWALGGGCELALACDLRLCSETAMLGQPERSVGIIPGYGAPTRLPRLIGSAKAKELIYTGRLIHAAEAERIGLVNKVVPKARLMDEAMAWAREMADGPVAVQYAKRAINESSDLDTGQALALASRLYGEVYKTKDCKEGITAFLEKRKPRFMGR
jgi:enoyl-CoA hydratase